VIETVYNIVFLCVFCTVIVRCTGTFWSPCRTSGFYFFYNYSLQWEYFISYYNCWRHYGPMWMYYFTSAGQYRVNVPKLNPSQAKLGNSEY